MNATTPTPTAAPPADATLTIPRLPWARYVAIGAAPGDRAGPRTLHRAGSLTSLRPASVHGGGGEAIDAVIKAVAVGCRVPLRPPGPTTPRREGRAGLEGDRVDSLGGSVARLRDVRDIDRAIHPPPDLAVEVENTRGAAAALPIDADLGVPEVWTHGMRRGTPGFRGRDAAGTCRPIARGLGCPALAADDVPHQLRRAHELRSDTERAGRLADRARDAIRPRPDPA